MAKRSVYSVVRNGKRVRNTAGFLDASGEFHPIRGSGGYDPVRAGEKVSWSARAKKKTAAKKKAAKRRSNPASKIKRNRMGQFVKSRR